MINPYHRARNYQFWRRSVAGVETHEFDPVVNPRFIISEADKVATAGSCFAQHISRKLLQSGLNYFITEEGLHLAPEVRAHAQYGLFSARYGNIYTTTQLLQLFDEAFGRFHPIETSWRRPDGRYVDPYRQMVEPNGFNTPAAVAEDRAKHLEAVRSIFLEADVFVFTLGLTEAWRSKQDGAVFSSAPGVVAGSFDEEIHEFTNFAVTDVYEALSRFLIALKEINPKVKVLLTVSPVPLIATYEDRSVLVSTTYSKSVLRVAADMAIKDFSWVEYFPSYEIITGSYSGGLYYEEDWREVSSIGVAHAMRCFLRNYLANRRDLAAVSPVITSPTSQIVCDEEALEAARG